MGLEVTDYGKELMDITVLTNADPLFHNRDMPAVVGRDTGGRAWYQPGDPV